MTARKPLQIFLAVEYALFLRELNVMFSIGRMGLFWTFFQPFFQIAILITIKTIIFGRGSYFDFIAFLALNFIAFNMFKSIISRSMGAFTASKGLFIYKQVKPIDTIIARVMAEIFITGIVILLFVMIGFYFDFDMNVKNLGMVFLGYLWLVIFAFSFGLFVSVVNTLFDSFTKVINLLLVGLMFLSAVFYTIESVPSELQTLLLYNPLVHFMEMIHGHYFYVLDDRFVDYSYMALWTVSLLFMGLWLYIRLEKRIISS